jgi:hypothetical protein
MLFMAEKRVDVALVQEPWLNRGKICGLRTGNYVVLHHQSTGKKSVCIVAKRSLNLMLLAQYSTDDLSVASFEDQGGTKLLLASVYMPYDEEEPPPIPVKNLVTEARKKGRQLVLGCDANGHHTQWGSKDINERGESILDFILTNNLTICNRGNVPTFVNRIREEVIDLTLTMGEGEMVIEDWRVSLDRSFSDHRRILFRINREVPEDKIFRNLKRTNWEKFGKMVEDFSEKGKLTPIPDNPRTETIEKVVKEIEKILNLAFRKTCPISRPRESTKPWWNENLRQIRTKARKLYNKAHKKSTKENWEKYKASFQEYKREIRKEKWQTFKEFSESINDVNEAARLRKVLSKGPTTASNIRRPDESWTESDKETLDLLMNTHFPGCKDYDPNEASNDDAQRDQETENRRKETANKIVTKEKVEWAIRTFSPYKSAGMDGVSPIMLQKSPKWVIERLTTIFQECLIQGYIPESWREVRVVFIPKAGKVSHTTPKEFRPISLSSFLLKTLERLIDMHIKENTDIEEKCTMQHAYLKGKSVESALHEVVSIIERNLHEKEYTLAAFLDIEGAFNNVQVEAIERALEQLGVEQMITNWIIKMLKSRIITSDKGNSSIKRRATRGTPQGGVISPLLWLIVINNILLQFKEKGIKMIAYADDVVILITGKDLPTIRDLMERALREIADWARENGLGVNPEKTELVLFTRKYKIPDFNPPKMEGKVLKLSKETKYLGITLDSKRSWERNVEERMKKGINAYYACKKLFGNRWDLRPYVIHWMYAAIVRPIITYGALVWWEAMNK